MADRWLTVAEAAARLRVTEGTVRRYIARDGLAVTMGRVRESELVAAEKNARERMVEGRTRARPVAGVIAAAETFAIERRLNDHERAIVRAFADTLNG